MSGWAGRYVGIPFAAAGLDRAGLHCWGLVRLVYREQAGIELPAYADLSADDLLAAARAFRAAPQAGPWRAAPPPLHALDCVVMSAKARDGARILRVPGHIGVMVDSGHVLHVWEATRACIMPLDHARIRARILSFHRHAALADEALT